MKKTAQQSPAPPGGDAPTQTVDNPYRVNAPTFTTPPATHSFTDLAAQRGLSRWALNRRFTTFWYIGMPNTPDPNRIYDQIFIDGTYTAAGCLLVAATRTHVITWYWAKSETTYAYTPAIEATSSTIVCCSRWWARRLRCHHILLADLENRTSSLLRQGYSNRIRAQHRNQKKTPQIDKVCLPATRRETHFCYLTQFWAIVQG